MKIGLRICINSLHGAVYGVPNLLELLKQYDQQASFFFALGEDRSNRLTRSHPLQTWRSRGSLISRIYKSLCHTSLQTDAVKDVMQEVSDAGHELGILSSDPVSWVDKAAHANEAWTRRQLVCAIERFEWALGMPPRCHAAAGWQVNPYLLHIEEEFDFKYSSDVLGKTLFFPHLQQIESACVQIPTTLPSMGEFLSQGGSVTADNVHQFVYAESQYILPHGQVYSLDAEIEGGLLLPQMEKLIVMWKGFSEGMTTLGALLDRTNLGEIAHHQIGWSEASCGGYYLARQARRA